MEKFIRLVNQALTEEKVNGTPLEAVLKVNKIRRPRSIQQNKLLWGVIYPQITAEIFFKTGKRIDEETFHNYYFKPKFCGKEVVKIGVNIITVAKSSTELSTAEFSRAVEELITEMATRFGINIELSEDDENQMRLHENYRLF